MARADSASVAIGFSTSTCLPASAAAMGLLGVQLVGGRDDHRVEFGVGKQGVEPVVDRLASRRPVPAGEVSGAPEIATHHAP